MSAPTPIDVRVLRQLDENLRAARRLKARWQVHAALIASAAAVLTVLDSPSELRLVTTTDRDAALRALESLEADR